MSIPRESHYYVRNSAVTRLDLSWWERGLTNCHSNCSFISDKVLPSHKFGTDAWGTGGGAHFRNDWVYSNQALEFPDEVESHINVLEIRMVLVALRR